MTKEIRVPHGHAGSIVLARWCVPDGGTVGAGGAICELDAGDATVDLPAARRGRIEHIAAAGDELRAGDLIGRFHDSD